jgi:hypothetical protein
MVFRALTVVVALCMILHLAHSAALFGLWPGDYTPTLANAASKIIKKNVAIQSVYAPMCNLSYFWFVEEMTEVWNNGRVPLFLWENQPGPIDDKGKPTTPCSTPSEAIERSWNDKLLAGDFDQYISDVGDNILEFLTGKDGLWGTADDRRMYIALSTEMNGNWRTWYGKDKQHGDPDKFVAMYRRTVDLLRKRIPQDGHTKTRVQFIWTINHKDVPSTKEGGIRAERFYPGSAYVDWVGVDGYNWGYEYGYWSPTYVFKSIFARLRKVGPGKPLAVIEVGVSAQRVPGKFKVAEKNKWITACFKLFVKSKVKMVIFFNQQKERDWENIGKTSKGDMVKIGYRFYSAWVKGLRNKFFIGSSKKNIRLISNKAFVGK